MNPPERRFPLPALLACAGIMLWRVLSVPPARLATDGFALLAVYGAFTVLGARWKAWPLVTFLAAAGLLALHFRHHLPVTLDYLRTVW